MAMKFIKGLNVEEIKRQAKLHNKVATRTLEIVEEMRKKQEENTKKLDQVIGWLKLTEGKGVLENAKKRKQN